MKVLNETGQKKVSSQIDKLTTKGDLLGYSTKVDRLAVGTTGQKLKADSGASFGLSWFSASDMVRLGSVNVTNVATIDITGLTGYGSYLFLLSRIRPATDSADFRMRTSTNNGSSFDASLSNYDWQNTEADSTTISGARTAADSTSITLTDTTGVGVDGVGNTTNESLWGRVLLFNPSAAAYGAIFYRVGFADSGDAIRITYGAGRRLTAADIDAVRFLFSSGNISLGRVDVYGIPSS